MTASYSHSRPTLETAFKLLTAVFLLFLTQALAAQAFPFRDTTTSYQDNPTTETWTLYPFNVVHETTRTMNFAVHPLFSNFRQTDNGNQDFDVLWPIFSYRKRPEKINATDHRAIDIFPLYFQKVEKRKGEDNTSRILLPIWFDGRQGKRGKYAILFPIFWYAHNARLAVPLFPPREQTFAALFPLIGDFRGYWNRDRIFFFLWPLYVRSEEGRGEDYNEVQSLIWPIFSRYSGPKVSGFRVWPLFAYSKKEGEYERYFWLWPLGHHRQGRISKTNPGQQDVTLFVPFYARFRQPRVSLDLVFPFYGKLKVGDRISQGYFLAIYNREYNLREKTREDRYLWFIIRKKRYLPGYTPEELNPEISTGGGVFPIYTRTESSKRIRKNVIWPFFMYKLNRYDEFEFERTYVVPFYAKQARKYTDGRYSESRFLFPFYRTRISKEGIKQTNILHLFFYHDVPPLDRLYAPLWTVWQREENLKTGERSTRVLKNVSRVERKSDGTVRRELNLFLVDYESKTGPGMEEEGRTRLLWGLAGLHKEAGQRRGQLLWVKF